MTPRRWPTSGFTLIELMVVVAIVAVLAVIALPSYRSYALRSNRSDAMAALTQNQAMLERCYAVNYSYAGCTGLMTASSQGYYTIAVANPDPTHYTVTATATGTQVNDTTCRTLSIDQTNSKTAADASGVAQSSCWNP